MEHETEARVAARAYDRAIRGRQGYGAGRLAVASQRGLRTVHNLCDGSTCPSVADLRRDLQVFRREGDGRDIRLLEDLLSDLGYEVRPAPRLVTQTALVALALHVPASAGEVAAGLAEALEDGQVDAGEAAELVPVLRHARHDQDLLDAALRAIPSPQLGLAVSR